MAKACVIAHLVNPERPSVTIMHLEDVRGYGSGIIASAAALAILKMSRGYSMVRFHREI